MLVGGTWSMRDTVRDRTKGREAGSSGDWSLQMPVKDKLVIERAEIFGCDVVGADKTVVVDRHNFLSFWNRSVRGTTSVC
jgi:hypothetical protein